jgi:hypothetical protein
VYREVPGIQGIADFVGIRASNWSGVSRRLVSQFDGVARAPAAEIIHLLRRGLDRGALLSSASYSRSVTQATVRDLIERGILIEKQRQLLWSSRFTIPNAELYFFELKLTKWQRALAQAIQARTYSDKVFCVFPMDREKSLNRVVDVFRAMNVGVLLFDHNDFTVREKVRAKKVGGYSRARKFDVLLRLASLHQRPSC